MQMTTPLNTNSDARGVSNRAPKTSLDIDDINKTSRFWCFTVNNYVCQYTGLPASVRYLVSGEEVGKDGTRHLQCYVELERSQRRSFVARIFPGSARVAVRYANSTAEQAAIYCKKDGKFVEFGQLSTVVSQQGKRNDLQRILEEITEGKVMDQIIAENKSTYVRNYRGIQAYKNIVCKPPIFRPNLKVHLYIGKTRLGKSYHARVNLGCWPKPIGKGLWFDGYEDEKSVVIDEFTGQYPLNDILQLTDPYRVRVETKGGHVWFQPDLIIFTTNQSPSDMYTERDQATRDAFFARFDKVFWWYGKQQFMELTDDQKNKLFTTGCYPHIPITTPTTVKPANLVRTQPPPLELKRTRPGRSLADELAASCTKKPRYTLDNHTGKHIRSATPPPIPDGGRVPGELNFTKQTLNQDPLEESLDPEQDLVLDNTQPWEEETQPTQLIEIEDSDSDEIIVPATAPEDLPEYDSELDTEEDSKGWSNLDSDSDSDLMSSFDD